MNRPAPRVLSCLLGASMLSLAAFAAAAQTVGTVALDTAAQVVVVDATDAANNETALTAAQAQLAAQQDADRDCMRHTGTRILPRARSSKRCIPEHGSVYTRDDLDRTGEVDMGRALRKLDTSIR